MSDILLSPDTKPIDPFANLETSHPRDSVVKSGRVRLVPSRFLPARVPWEWLVLADNIGGSALAVGLIAFRNRARTAPYGWPNKIGLEAGADLGLGRWAIRNGINRLEKAGLIRVVWGSGKKAVVEILREKEQLLVSDHPTEKDWKYQYIGPKIPWGWLCEAAQVPTPGLIFGLAAWRQEIFTFEPSISRVPINPLRGSNRSPKELKRGARDLDTAGLIELVEAQRNFVRVRILEQNSSVATKTTEE